MWLSLGVGGDIGQEFVVCPEPFSVFSKMGEPFVQGRLGHSLHYAEHLHFTEHCPESIKSAFEVCCRSDLDRTTVGMTNKIHERLATPRCSLGSPGRPDGSVGPTVIQFPDRFSLGFERSVLNSSVRRDDSDSPSLSVVIRSVESPVFFGFHNYALILQWLSTNGNHKNTIFRV